MELQEAILKRRSIRKFKEDKVKEEDVNLILQMAMAGPSACNKKPWEFFVITNEEILHKFANVSKSSSFKAPLAIVVCGNEERMLEGEASSYWIQDCSSATENILLCATSLGLGSLWCGVYPQQMKIEKVREILELPNHIIPLNIIYIGYSDMDSEARSQYEENYVHHIK